MKHLITRAPPVGLDIQVLIRGEQEKLYKFISKKKNIFVNSFKSYKSLHK